MIIAIDGPAGSGKSTTAKLLAKKLGGILLDTGAMYRSVTLAALEKNADTKDSDQMAEIARNIRIDFVEGEAAQRTLVNGLDRSADIRTKRVDANVSHVAAHKDVRVEMVNLQRKIATSSNIIVCEGRDVGSVVFPGADFKFYIHADPAKRAARRAMERGEEMDESALEEISKRDRLDTTRKESPLKIPDGAHVIDNTDLSIDETLKKLLELCA
jgi:cytidylate kinase